MINIFRKFIKWYKSPSKKEIEAHEAWKKRVIEGCDKWIAEFENK